MNNRNIFLVGLSTAIILLFLSSCDYKRTSTQDPQFPQQDVVDDSKTNYIKKEDKDSMQYLNAKNGQKSQLRQNSVDNEKTKTKIKEVQNLKFWIWFALSIGSLSFLFSIISLSRYASLNRRIEEWYDEIYYLKKDLDKFSHQLQSTLKNSVPADYEKLKQRISELEKGVKLPNSNIVSNRSSVVSQNERKINPTTSKNQTKKGYFGNPIKETDPYFEYILPNKDSDARFCVKYDNLKAFFSPLEGSKYLGALTTSDNLRLAVEFTGCDPQNAVEMRTTQPGEAEFRNGNWYITKRAIVNLS